MAMARGHVGRFAATNPQYQEPGTANLRGKQREFVGPVPNAEIPSGKPCGGLQALRMPPNIMTGPVKVSAKGSYDCPAFHFRDGVV